ncbi:DUF6705 family protein [Chryseobacterium echinoideorum]|uniref:DUF6705 family protein n=1 Tax=Chryseobacterium echinoideorum TaxID=1549648 RepID=UPI0011856DFF|nr:DUF6705 family protein [Chryseobacterium echinoideorum]
MKTIFKVTLFIGVIANALSCKAQVIQPLNTKLKDAAQNAYLKDLDNDLNKFIGIYTSTYQDKSITLYITKEYEKLIQSHSKSYYQDVLSVRYIVKDLSGLTLQDTQNTVFQPNQIRFTIYSVKSVPQENFVILIYGGTNCGIGWGEIRLKKLNSTQLSWEYNPNSLVIDSATCPPGTDKKVYLPVTKDLIFTKQ